MMALELPRPHKQVLSAAPERRCAVHHKTPNLLSGAISSHSDPILQKIDALGMMWSFNRNLLMKLGRRCVPADSLPI